MPYRVHTLKRRIYFTRDKGYAVLILGTCVMFSQSIISSTTGFSHAKQLVALVPLILCDLACLGILGPSPMVKPSGKFLLVTLLCLIFSHGLKTWKATLQYRASPSPESLVQALQSNVTIAIHLIAFPLNHYWEFSVWRCLRGCHLLVGVVSISLCIALRLYGPSSSRFPPLQGSFEGAIITYLGFCACALYFTPAQCRRLHYSLGACLPEGWLPLSALKSEDLKGYMEEYDALLHPRDRRGVSRDHAQKLLQSSQARGTAQRRAQFSKRPSSIREDFAQSDAPSDGATRKKGAMEAEDKLF